MKSFLWTIMLFFMISTLFGQEQCPSCLVEILHVEFKEEHDKKSKNVTIVDKKINNGYQYKYSFEPEQGADSKMFRPRTRCLFYANTLKLCLEIKDLFKDDVDTTINVANVIEYEKVYVWYFKDKEFAYVIPLEWETTFEDSSRITSHIAQNSDKVYVRFCPTPCKYNFFNSPNLDHLNILTSAATYGDVDAQRLLGVWNARKSRNDKNKNFKAEAKKWLNEVKKKCPKDANWINAMLSDNHDKWYAADVEFDLFYSGHSK